MANVHLVLQGKGGVGKSMIAAMLAQFKQHQSKQPLCIDTDPINATFSGYGALKVKRINIMEGDEINTRRFDELIELIANETENDVIVDNGASSFVPLSHYLISNQIPSLLNEMGHTLTIHTVITGGQALMDTLTGFSQLTNQFPEECKFVVWLNPYWGPIEADGKQFEQMKAYTANKGKVSALIQIPTLKEETHGYDFSTMLKNKQTFKESLDNESLPIMVRQRLKTVQKAIFGQIEQAMVI